MGGPGGGRRLGPALAVTGIVVLVALLRFGFFVHEPPGRDQGVFANLADGVLRGKLLYRDLWENKPPAIVWLYASAFAAFGRDYAVIHALQAAFATTTALALAWLVRGATASWAAPLAAAVLYLVHAGGLAFGGFWGTAQAEVFMDLPILGGLALLLEARRSKDRRAWLLTAAAGACIGSTLLLKYSAAPLLGLGALAWWSDVPARRRILRGGAFVAGYAFPCLVWIAATMVTGSWIDFFRETVLFNADYRAATEPSEKALLARWFYALPVLLAVYVPAMLGMGAALRPGPGGNAREERDLARIGVWLWLLTLAEVFWQGRFWIYHYHVVLLPLSLLAGLGISRAMRWAPADAGVVRRGTVLAASLAALSLAHVAKFVSYDRSHGVTARWRGQITAEQMESTYRWGATDYEFAQTKAVARAIASEVPRGGRIFVWGFEPYVYFLSGREPASRFLYDLPLMPGLSSLQPLFAEQLLEDLRRHPPARVLVVVNDANDVEASDSVTQLLAWTELRAWLDGNYRPTWRLGDFLCFAPRTAPATP